MMSLIMTWIAIAIILCIWNHNAHNNNGGVY